MNIDQLAINIMLDEECRNKIIRAYSKGIEKIGTINIDDVLDSVVKQLNKKHNDKLLEAYILFLINIGLPLKKQEQDLIIDYSNKLFTSDVFNLDKNEIYIIVIGKIMEEARKNNLQISFDIDYLNKDMIQMNPSIVKKHNSYQLTGRIRFSNNIFDSDLSNDKHLIILLFMFYHELDHLIRLNHLNNTNIDTKEKVRYVKEFLITFLLSNGDLYSYHHNSFLIEKHADKYAYSKTMSLIEKSSLLKKEELIKFVKLIYLENKELDDLDEKEFKKLLNSNCSFILKNMKSELKDLCLYFPAAKNILNIKKNKQKRL